MQDPRCCCFNLHQGSMVACFVIILFYGISALGVVIDLGLSLSLRSASFIACEAILFIFLQLQIAAAGFLARAVTSRNVKRLYMWLVWHAACWLLLVVMSSCVVTAALILTENKAGAITGAILMPAVLALLAYVWSVMLRLYLCWKQNGNGIDEDNEKKNNADA